MDRTRWTLTALLAVTVAGSSGCQFGAADHARLYPGLDTFSRPIATSSAESQRWFDQGLILTYGFNHAEAIRSFEQAAVHDPTSPMPWWGIAYCHGMNINDPIMTEERWQAAAEAIDEAKARLVNANEREAALVHALDQRYSWPPPAEQATTDKAYADAMQTLWEQYPNDPDIGALFAESLMDLQPWDYWTNEGEQKGRIGEILATLEAVLVLQQDHPAANHLYIHAVEASQSPERGVPAAERLANRIPGSGHLVHMPSHIYVRVGRYADAADANTRAVAIDRRYFDEAPKPDVYLIYYAHNLHFLAYASMMEGRYQDAIAAGRALEREIGREALETYGGLIEGIMPTTFHAMIRFGKWEEILAEPKRPRYRLVSNAVRHYARGIAYSALGKPQEARAEIAAFDAAASQIPEDWFIFNNKVDTVLPIARLMLQGELAFREGRHEEAFSLLRQAIELEDALVYDEPPGWMLPVRHPLGAFLMSSGRYGEAEEVYREDLRRNRSNGWSLLGLKLALEAQGQVAGDVSNQLADAWARADVTPTSSCMCEP